MPSYGRCLVGESAIGRGFAWCAMALYGQLRGPSTARAWRLGGSPKAGVAGSNPAGGTLVMSQDIGAALNLRLWSGVESFAEQSLAQLNDQLDGGLR